jgi:CRP-like cAMP-binding protein
VCAGDGDVFTPLELSREDTAFLQRVAWETVSAATPYGAEDVDGGDWSSDGDLEAALLREISLVRGLPADDADDLLTRGSRIRIPAGTRILSEGERGRAAHIVLDGDIRLQTSQGFDETFAPWSMGLALEMETRSLLGEPYGCTATAETDLTVLVIRDVELEALAVEKPALADAVMRNVASAE